MNLIRREPSLPLFTRFETPFYREMEEMSDRLGKLFGTWTRPFEIKESLKVADFTPAVDIQETEKEYLLKVEIPEVKKEEVSVVVQENVLDDYRRAQAREGREGKEIPSDRARVRHVRADVRSSDGCG